MSQDVATRFSEALAYQTSGLLSEAERGYREVLTLDPDHVDGSINLAVIYKNNGREAEAETLLQKILARHPDNAVANNNFGRLLEVQRRFEEARQCYQRAVDVAPDYYDALNNLGNALRNLEQNVEAEACYLRALEINPACGQALNNLGLLAKRRNHYDSAEQFARLAISRAPELVTGYWSLADLYTELGRTAEAEPLYRHVLAANQDADALDAYLMCLHYHIATDSQKLLDEAVSWSEKLLPAESKKSFSNERSAEKRLKIAYISGDFRHHPVAYFLESVLQHRNQEAFEVCLYSTCPPSKHDEITQRISRLADVWVDADNYDDGALVDLIRRDGIDILIDLSGYTRYHRMPVFAMRAAPLQISWLGYFGTTGIRSMDYIICDSSVLPTGDEQFFVEKPLRMPNSYLCFSRPVEEVEVGTLRGAGPITFGCLNKRAKITTDVIAVWTQILHCVPDSQIFLKAPAFADESARRSIRAEFAAFGISAERVLLEAGGERLDMLRSYQRVDIALDTFPYGGGTTTAESLWMGVPVVTMFGERWVGRVSASLLQEVGLSELITTDIAGYVELAASLALDTDRLFEIRQELRARVEGSPVCDAAGFASNLEQIYREAWRNWCD